MIARFSLDDLMVIEASRHIKDENIVLVGTGLPMVASLLAQKLHAPKMCYVVETGNIAPEVIPTPSSVCDPRVMYKAIKHGSLLDSLGGILQRGLADIAFLGGAQIESKISRSGRRRGPPFSIEHAPLFLPPENAPSIILRKKFF